jgi:hypothetical protein
MTQTPYDRVLPPGIGGLCVALLLAAVPNVGYSRVDIDKQRRPDAGRLQGRAVRHPQPAVDASD